MLALWIVEQLDVFEHVSSCVATGGIGSASGPFSCQELEDTLGNGVVVAVAASAHAGAEVFY